MQTKDLNKKGKEILNHLRKDNVGSVSIFALEKMPQFHPPRDDLPGPRLVDQITCEDSRLMRCFYKVQINGYLWTKMTFARY